MIEQIQKAPEALPLSRKCRLAGISRATYYRHAKQTPVSAVSVEKTDQPLRQSLHRIALETTGYGYRRMTHHLHREGVKVNHKKVRRLMQEEKLLIPTKKRFVVTTDSDHEGPFYPNLAKKLEVSNALDKLWVGGYYICPSASWLLLSGRAFGCLLTSLHRLGGGEVSGCPSASASPPEALQAARWVRIWCIIRIVVPSTPARSTPRRSKPRG